jgi:hypothetical protein
MLEIIAGIAICIMVAKIADFENRSMILWFGITFVLCVGAIFLPLPFIRFLLAGAAALGGMFVLKLVGKE